MTEPALPACRELLNIPVVGILQASLAAVSNDSTKVTVVTPRFHPNYAMMISNRIRAYNHNLKVDICEIDITDPSEKPVLNQLKTNIQQRLIQDETQAVILASGYLSKYKSVIEKYLKEFNQGTQCIIPLESALTAANDHLLGKKNIQDLYTYSPPSEWKVTAWKEKISVI